MRTAIFTFTFATLTSPIFAACPAPQHTILSCTFEQGRKVIDACHDNTTARYAFGEIGQKPDLILNSPITDLYYEPWNGMGQSMNEIISFDNEDVSYNLWVVGDASPENPVDEKAGLTVMMGPDHAIEMLCDAGSITLGFETVYEAKDDMGLCWNDDEYEWLACK